MNEEELGREMRTALKGFNKYVEKLIDLGHPDVPRLLYETADQVWREHYAPRDNIIQLFPDAKALN